MTNFHRCGERAPGRNHSSWDSETPHGELHGDFGRTAQDPDLNAGQAETGQASSTVTLTPEQRTRIRETVLVGRNAPRVSSVNFKIAVGTAVPSTVHVAEVPEVIVEIHPEWRGYWYFVVGDEIIIVDRGP
jgi:hypothetical protein